jgi:hypothetical protein
MDNPFETPIPRGVRLVQATLRVVVAVQCWGMAAARLHLKHDTTVGRFLAAIYEIPQVRVDVLEDYAAYALIAAGLVTLVRPCWPVLLPVSGWFLATTAAGLWEEMTTATMLDAATHTVRIAVPIALILIDFWPPSLRPTLSFCRTTILLLQLATAVTFVAYGLIAMQQFRNGGPLVDTIVLAVQKVWQRTLAPASVQQTLAIIGAVDVGAAFVMLTSRSRTCALWLATWGLATASLYFLAQGVTGYHESLIRVADGGAPLAVLLFWLRAVREQQPQFVPDYG